MPQHFLRNSHDPRFQEPEGKSHMTIDLKSHMTHDLKSHMTQDFKMEGHMTQDYFLKSHLEEDLEIPNFLKVTSLNVKEAMK